MDNCFEKQWTQVGNNYDRACTKIQRRGEENTKRSRSVTVHISCDLSGRSLIDLFVSRVFRSIPRRLIYDRLFHAAPICARLSFCFSSFFFHPLYCLCSDSWWSLTCSVFNCVTLYCVYDFYTVNLYNFYCSEPCNLVLSFINDVKLYV